jgi:hypothetical protein
MVQCSGALYVTVLCTHLLLLVLVLFLVLLLVFILLLLQSTRGRVSAVRGSSYRWRARRECLSHALTYGPELDDRHPFHQSHFETLSLVKRGELLWRTESRLGKPKSASQPTLLANTQAPSTQLWRAILQGRRAAGAQPCTQLAAVISASSDVCEHRPRPCTRAQWTAACAVVSCSRHNSYVCVTSP